VRSCQDRGGDVLEAGLGKAIRAAGDGESRARVGSRRRRCGCCEQPRPEVAEQRKSWWFMAGTARRRGMGMFLCNREIAEGTGATRRCWCKSGSRWGFPDA